MAKKIFFVIMCSFFVVFLSGCELISDPKSLMSVPKLPSDKETLRSLINSELPKGASVIRPTHFKDSSAIRISDLNPDGVKEAVLFYETPDQEVRIHGMIWKSVGNTWKKIVDFDGEGTQLDSFVLQDLTGDGRLDIIAGYSNADLKQQNGLVVVYNYKGELLLEHPSYDFVMNDINMDGVNELSIINKRQDQMFTLTTYRYIETLGTFKELSSLNLDNEIEGYYHVGAGIVSSSKREGIVLDARVNSFQGYTSVVIFQDGKLQEANAISRDATQKGPLINSYDVDEDEIIEIGRQEKAKGWENKSPIESPWFIKYYQWDGLNNLKLIQTQYQEENVYTLKFPTEWNDIISIDPHSFTKNYIRFINVKNDETLAEVRKFPASLWDQYKNSWKIISRSVDSIYAVLSDVDLKVSKAKMDTTLTKKGIGGNENR